MYNGESDHYTVARKRIYVKRRVKGWNNSVRMTAMLHLILRTKMIEESCPPLTQEECCSNSHPVETMSSWYNGVLT